VDGHRVVEVLLRGTHRDRHGDALHHLVDALADAVAAHHLQMAVVLSVVFASDLADNFEEALLLVLLLGGRVEHVGEAAGKDLDLVVAQLGSGFLGGEAAGADGWVREDHCRDVVVVDFEVSSAIEKSLGEAATSSDGDGSQGNLVGNIADSVHAWNSRVLELIDNDSAAVDRHTGSVESERLNVGRTAESNKALVALDGLSRLQVHVESAILVLSDAIMW